VNVEAFLSGNMQNVTYPQQVEEALEQWQDALEEPSFLEEQGIHANFVKEAAWSTFGPALMDIWLQTGEAQINEELAETLIKRFIVATYLLEMKDAGFIDSIENEHGEEVYWATAKAKEYGKKNM